jgi:hypothetical protein
MLIKDKLWHDLSTGLDGETLLIVIIFIKYSNKLSKGEMR